MFAREPGKTGSASEAPAGTKIPPLADFDHRLCRLEAGGCQQADFAFPGRGSNMLAYQQIRPAPPPRLLEHVFSCLFWF